MLEPHKHGASDETASQAPTVAASTSSTMIKEEDEGRQSIHSAKEASPESHNANQAKANEDDRRSIHSTKEKVSSDSEDVGNVAPIPLSNVPSQVEKVNGLANVVTARSQKANTLREVQTREDGVEYPTGVKLGLITLALCLSVFLIALDNSIIATAIPKISEEFHSLADVGWYGSAYLLTTASLQLMFGKFYTFLSIKSVYLVAIVIFEIGSLICGVAPNSVTLIIGRAIAGAGSAGVFSGALLILAYSVPLAKRPIYTGLIGGMYGIASVAGPLLGGAFTDKATWRWCFYINLPIGAITLLVIFFFFESPKTPQSKDDSLMQRVRRFDPVGTVLLMPAVICLLLALQWGGTQYAWNDGRIIALFVLFGVLIMGFIGVQFWAKENATVPPRIFADRTVWSGSLFAFMVGSAFFIFIYYLPIWFQSVQGQTAVNSGIRNLPMLIAVVIASIVAGGLVSAFGHYVPWMLLGSVLMSIGAGLLTTFTPSISSGGWIGYQILFGLGVGVGMQQPMIAVQVALDIKDVPTGTSVVIFMQTLGGALFISVAQSIFTNQLVQSLIVDAPGVDPKLILASGATKLRDVVSADMLSGVLLSYNTALTKAFTVGIALSVLSFVGAVIIPWKSVKGKKIEMGMA